MAAAVKLAGVQGVTVQLRPQPTRGDMPAGDQPSPDSAKQLGSLRQLGPGAFTAELDEAVLRGDADMAVHSLKDAPPAAAPGLKLAGCLPREDPRDVLLSLSGAHSLAALPRGTVVGTSSSRRAAQVLAADPGLRVAPLRGNVDARVAQMRSGGAVGATLLALAGG